jgi:hypothetical protein
MPVRIKRYSTNAGIAGDDDATEYLDDSLDQRTVTDSEGYSYIFGVNQAINFLDDGRGLASTNTADNIVQDAIPFGTSRA